MLKNWFTRLARIASGSFGSAKEDGFSLETSLTKFERFFHFWVLVVRSFVRNRCPIRASALSYFTLVAMIPMLAVAISVTNAFLESKGEAHIRAFIEEFVEKIAPTPIPPPEKPGAPPVETGELSTASLDAIQLDLEQLRAKEETSVLYVSTNVVESPLLPPAALVTNMVAGTETNTGSAGQVSSTKAANMTEAKQSVSKQAANFIYDFAAKSSSATLGLTGVFFLIVTAIMTLTRVEETFNDIWGVTRGRDWWSRITNYTFTIGFGPFLLIVALGLMNGPNFQRSRDLIRVVPFLEPLLTSILPVLIICFTFAVFYKLVPNTKVDFGAALVGGSLAGLAWHGYNNLGWLLASRAVDANAIYGSLFIVPLLMGGLYVVWLTVLFGAQVAYAFQNRESYLQDRLVENVNQRGREFVALRLMTCIGQRFNRGQAPATVREISTELGIPSKLVQQIMRTLLAAGLVVEVNGRETGYSPARPLETINCHHILLAMRATHGQEPATRDEPVRVEVVGEFARIQEAERAAASAVSMLALVNRAQARLEAGAAKPLIPTPVAVVDAPPVPIEVMTAESQEKFTPQPVAAGIGVPVEKVDVSAGAEPEIARTPAGKSFASTHATASTPNNENESFPL